jgi:hypothetical protein
MESKLSQQVYCLFELLVLHEFFRLFDTFLPIFQKVGHTKKITFFLNFFQRMIAFMIGAIGAALANCLLKDERTGLLLSVDALSPAIGARVNGVRLADAPLASAVVEQLRNALLQHHVLFFENQSDLSPTQHRALAQQFGRLHSEFCLRRHVLCTNAHARSSSSLSTSRRCA